MHRMTMQKMYKCCRSLPPVASFPALRPHNVYIRVVHTGDQLVNVVATH